MVADIPVRIFDTTLRDGEQSPGAGLTVAEKLPPPFIVAVCDRADVRDDVREPPPLRVAVLVPVLVTVEDREPPPLNVTARDGVTAPTRRAKHTFASSSEVVKNAVVAPDDPPPVRVPHAIPMAPSDPAFEPTSTTSVNPVRLLFVHPE